MAKYTLQQAFAHLENSIKEYVAEEVSRQVAEAMSSQRPSGATLQPARDDRSSMKISPQEQLENARRLFDDLNLNAEEKSERLDKLGSDFAPLEKTPQSQSQSQRGFDQVDTAKSFPFEVNPSSGYSDVLAPATPSQARITTLPALSGLLKKARERRTVN